MSKKTKAEKQEIEQSYLRIKNLIDSSPESERKNVIDQITIDQSNNSHCISNMLLIRANYYFPMIEYLLENGMDVNAGDQETRPLHTAIFRIKDSKDRKKAIELLLKHGADMYDIYDNDNSGQYGHPTAYLFATNQPELLDLFIANGYDINFADPNGETILHRAAATDRYYFVEKCLEVGFNPMTLNKIGESPYFLASDEKIKKLIGKKIAEIQQMNLNAPDMPVVTKRYVRPPM